MMLNVDFVAIVRLRIRGRAKGYLRLSECKYILGIFLDFKKTLVT